MHWNHYLPSHREHTICRPQLTSRKKILKKKHNKANPRDLIAATALVILLKLDLNHWFFILYDLKIRWITSKNNRAPLPGHIKLCALFQSHQWIPVTIQKCSIQVKNGQFFILCDLEIWQMTLKNNRAPLLCFFKLFVSFHSISQFKLELQSGNPIFGDFLPRVTLKFDRWPWKTIGHLFYATSSFLHHFIAISQYKLELQSGNAKFGSKSVFFCPVGPWNLTDDLGKQ